MGVLPPAGANGRTPRRCRPGGRRKLVPGRQPQPAGGARVVRRARHRRSGDDLRPRNRVPRIHDDAAGALDGARDRRRRARRVGERPAGRPPPTRRALDRPSFLRDLSLALAGARARRSTLRTPGAAHQAAPRRPGSGLVGAVAAPARGPRAPFDMARRACVARARPRRHVVRHGGSRRCLAAHGRRTARLGGAGGHPDLGSPAHAAGHGCRAAGRRGAGRRSDDGPDGDPHRLAGGRRPRLVGRRQPDGAGPGPRPVGRTCEPAPFVARRGSGSCRRLQRRLRRDRTRFAAQRLSVRRRGRQLHGRPVRRLPCRPMVPGARSDGRATATSS